MSFHLTQLITGHFNEFLLRIDRAPSAGCSLCGPPDNHAKEEDDALHTLVRSEAFECDRECLVLIIGQFDPGHLFSRILESPSDKEAVVRFTDSMMSAKEEVEREGQLLHGVARYDEREEG